jgi:hypothetical protein
MKFFAASACSAVLLFASVSAQARCPVAGDLTIIPASPAPNDNVLIRLRVYNSFFFNFQGQRVGNQISLQAWTNSMAGTLPLAQDLDWPAGQLPAGSYSIVLNTQWANMIPATTCPTVTTGFTVAGVPSPPAVPAPIGSPWLLALMAGLLGWVGSWRIRRRAVRPRMP